MAVEEGTEPRRGAKLQGPMASCLRFEQPASEVIRAGRYQPPAQSPERPDLKPRDPERHDPSLERNSKRDRNDPCNDTRMTPGTTRDMCRSRIRSCHEPRQFPSPAVPASMKK